MADAPARPRLVPDLPDSDAPEATPQPSGPVPATDAERLAFQVQDALKAAAGLIEELQYPHPETRRSARGARTVSKEFVRSMAALVDNSELLQQLGIYQSPRARASLQFLEAFVPVLHRSQTFTEALSYTLEAVHADLVEEALQAYRVANAVTRRGKNAELAAQLRILKKILGRKNGKAAATQEEPEPE